MCNKATWAALAPLASADPASVVYHARRLTSDLPRITPLHEKRANPRQQLGLKVNSTFADRSFLTCARAFWTRDCSTDDQTSAPPSCRSAIL